MTSDAGLLAYRELDDALGLTALAGGVVADSRTGRNGWHGIVSLLRQSVYGRLAGYEDVNDADRLGRDPAMRWIVGGKAVERGGASTSQMGLSTAAGICTGAAAQKCTTGSVVACPRRSYEATRRAALRCRRPGILNRRHEMPPSSDIVAPVGAEHNTLYVAIEISRKSWVVGIKSPASERIGLHSLGCCSACNFDPQYQATSIAYRADRRATHAPNNTQAATGDNLIGTLSLAGAIDSGATQRAL